MTMKMETINSSPIKFGNPKKKKLTMIKDICLLPNKFWYYSYYFFKCL